MHDVQREFSTACAAPIWYVLQHCDMRGHECSGAEVWCNSPYDKCISLVWFHHNKSGSSDNRSISILYCSFPPRSWHKHYHRWASVYVSGSEHSLVQYLLLRAANTQHQGNKVPSTSNSTRFVKCFQFVSRRNYCISV